MTTRRRGTSSSSGSARATAGRWPSADHRARPSGCCCGRPTCLETVPGACFRSGTLASAAASRPSGTALTGTPSKSSGGAMARDSFRDKVVIVTGASDGIGRELAVQLAAEGACLALASRNADRLNAVAAECVARGGRAVVIPTDVSDREACGRLVEKTVAAFGRIDMLISNAGISMWARFADVKDPEMIERILRVNFLGAMYCTWHALPYLRQSRGRIVAVSSISGWYPAPTGSGYAASKYALRGFFDSI